MAAECVCVCAVVPAAYVSQSFGDYIEYGTAWCGQMSKSHICKHLHFVWRQLVSFIQLIY